ncbi:MAG: trehalose-phosphatase [bacterium]|nr:trehalose-phosphatase [bacterium]
MELINSKSWYPSFFETLRKSHTSLLLLDYDGTLSPFTVDRERAVPYEGVIPLLIQIRSTGRTRLVIVSGRSVKSLRHLVGNDLNCEIWGSHGLERSIPGKNTEIVKVEAEAQALLNTIMQWAKENNLLDNLENKPFGCAFHWRGESPEWASQIMNLVADKWLTRLQESGYDLHSFDGGLEIRPKGVSKADAVNTLLRESPDVSTVSYLGDDLTDEDAFRALGNRGLKVLVRSESRPTLADLRIEPPGELLKFLSDWLEAVSA